MSKLYFGSTNAGYITIATDDEFGRACYLHEDGMEGAYYPSKFDLDEIDTAERTAVCERWLHEIADYNNFDSLYADCDVEIGYCGTVPENEVSEVLDGIDVYAELEF